MSNRSRGHTVATIWPQLQVSTVKTAMLLRTIHGVDPVWIGAISAVGGASATGLFSWLKSMADKRSREREAEAQHTYVAKEARGIRCRADEGAVADAGTRLRDA